MLNKGQLQEAAEKLREATLRDSLHYDAHGNLGVALARSGKLAEAEASFKAAKSLVDYLK